MKLTTRGRYAVQALADIAAARGEAPVSLPDIAIRQGISAGYLEQLFAKLRRAGLVMSVRGVSGGYRLARAASSIRISEIVEAVDEEIQTTACSGKPAGCQGAGARCLTHDLWDELGRQIEIFLNAVTLEDVIERRILGMAAVNAPSPAAAASSSVYRGSEVKPTAALKSASSASGGRLGGVKSMMPAKAGVND